MKKFGMREVLGKAEDITSKDQSAEFLQLQKKQYGYHIITYSKKIRDLAKALRYVPGQKHIVFFSSGIEYLALSQIMRDYEEMTKEMAASNCTIHSVYTEASDADMNLELDKDTYVLGRKMSEIPKKDSKETGVFSLERLSEVTGGRYSGIHLFQPLVFIPDKEATYTYAQKGQKKANSGFLDLAAIYPSISGQSSVLIEEVDKGVSKLLAEVRCLMIGIQDPEIDLSASLIPLSNTQEVMPLSFSILSCSEKKEMDILLLEFRLPELESGQYSLNLVANEIKTKSISEVNLPLKIKSQR